MDFIPNDLLVFLVRWSHVIAAISWIGNSFYFMWLDANLEIPDNNHPDRDLEGSLWMVHSGGFYRVERRKIGPGRMPAILHWFKWEATLTWLTGFLLLSLVFYSRGGVLLANSNSTLFSPLATVGLSLAILVGSWFIYDILWNSLAASEWLAKLISGGLLLGLVLICTEVFSGRGAFIHLGAVFATLMVLNVWVRILPAQSAMIAATERGEEPDFSLAKKAKLRSTHNSYLTLPVLFAMLASHMAAATNHHLAWILILLFALFGGLIRHMMILRVQGQRFLPWSLPSLAVLAVIFVLMTWDPSAQSSNESSGLVTIERAETIIQTRCVSCHAEEPADDRFGPLPAGVGLETREQMIQFADKIRFMAIETKAMPLGNFTKMTDSERDELDAWLETVIKK